MMGILDQVWLKATVEGQRLKAVQGPVGFLRHPTDFKTLDGFGTLDFRPLTIALSCTRTSPLDVTDDQPLVRYYYGISPIVFCAIQSRFS